MKRLLPLLLLATAWTAPCVAGTAADAPDFEIEGREQPLPGFQRFSHTYTYTPEVASAVNYELTVDCPDESIPHHAEIIGFLLQNMGADNTLDTMQAGKQLSDNFFDEINEFWNEDFEDEYTLVPEARTAYLAYTVNKRYVTFSEYYFSYTGGIHGMYYEGLTSYDLITNQPVTGALMFRAGTEESVKCELCKVIFNDERYREMHYNYDIATLADVQELFDAENLPTVGLLEEGAVFTFAPYQIGSYGEGCYHFLVPWSKLRPYMTAEGKALTAK